ncbi:MAG: hypothetical protein IJH20_01345 [Bacilli bacterium]|nr:hypothetical protein [Bacilli bacterium]
MNKKIKVILALLFAGFSFYYTYKVSDIIKNNDPIMSEIRNKEKDIVVSKIESTVFDDEYLTGLNGCIIDEKNSYDKMKKNGHYNEELLVMKEDEINKNSDKYIIGGNKEKRNVSIILLENNESIEMFIKKNNIKIDYFLDGEYLSINAPKLIDINKYVNIYNYGRNGTYNKKYMVYDNAIINNNFSNESKYCLVTKKEKSILDLCTAYGMNTIKAALIKDDVLSTVKQELTNGKIFLIDNKNSDELKYSIKYILSKGYNIVHLEELLSTKKECNN